MWEDIKKSMVHTQEKRAVNRNCPQGNQTLNSLDKVLKSAILNMLKELKEIHV